MIKWKFKKQAAIVVIAIFSVGMLSGCSNSNEPQELTGEYFYQSETFNFEADVTDSVINIYLIMNENRALYWTGTFEDTALVDEVLVSDADIDELALSLFGSLSETKEFTIGDGTLIYDFSIMAIDSTITLNREE